MIYFCADDYGVSVCGNRHIEECLERGILNKVSVIPNGEITDFKNRLKEHNAHLSLHLNLVEGRPLSKPCDIGLLVSEDGYFKYSFAGLLLLSLSSKRKELEKQLYLELQCQVRLWKELVGENALVSIDGHQHTHTIPLIFKTLMRVIRDENLEVASIRIPAEPISPYLLTPSLYMAYSPVGLIKQWLLKILTLANRKELKQSNIPYAYFAGVLFSGRVDEEVLKKLLPRYIKLAEKNNKDIEIGIHPGYIEQGEPLLEGARKGFRKFYDSPWRKAEYHTLLNLKL